MTVPDTAGQADASAIPVSLWGLLGLVAPALAVLGVLRTVPDVPPVGTQTAEWQLDGGQGAAVVVASALLGLLALAADRRGGSTSAPGPAAAAALLALAWASLAPAVWATAPLLRASALVALCLTPAALLHVTVAGSLVLAGRTVPRAALVTAYLVCGGTALLHVLSRDPFLDPGCVVHCTSLHPPLASPWLAASSGAAVRLAWAALAAVVLLLALGVLGRACPRQSWALLSLAGAAAATELAWVLAPGARAGLGPAPLQVPHLLELRAATHAGLALAVLVVVLRRARRRGALRQLAREITEIMPPQSLRDVVATRLGDPSVQLDLHVPTGEGWVDEHGRPVTEPATDGRSGDAGGRQCAVVRRDGLPVARIRFTAGDARARDLEEVLGPATLLAVEARRTHAEQLLRLRTLRATRRLAVEASDTARRRAERDLHDGAQHLLLAVTFALQEALEGARRQDDATRAEQLGQAVVEASLAAQELRTLARGLYPVLLGDAGLVPALEGLAMSSPVSLSLDTTPVPRLDTSTELTAYRAVALAARSCVADGLAVRLVHRPTSLVLEVAGAALHPAEEQALADRAEALGGTMVTVDGTLTLELPCG